MEASPKLKDGRMAPPSRLAAGRMRRRIVAAAVRGSGLAALSSLALLWAHLLHQMPSMDGHYNHRSASEGPWNRHRALNEARLSETPVASEFDKCGSIVNDQEVAPLLNLQLSRTGLGGFLSCAALRRTSAVT